MKYFSDREGRARPRELEKISANAWGGIRALIRGRIEDGSFGAGYPMNCDDGAGPIGTDESSFLLAVRGEIPEIRLGHWGSWLGQPQRTTEILDLIEFCFRCVGKPTRVGYHDFFKHHHLEFDLQVGQAEFRNDINRVFRRNGLAYKITAKGRIRRLAPPVLREELASAHFQTGDSELDKMLERARHKFLDPSEATRREALEVLWDAWERLKTLGDGSNKRTQSSSMLDNMAGSSSPNFRQALEREATELTWIGNNLQIRHSERTQERLAEGVHVDYLFHRLLSLMQAILRKKTIN